MLTWFSANIGTLLVGLVVLAIVVGIILSMRRDKKQGKSCCSGCSGCAGCSSCHTKP